MVDADGFDFCFDSVGVFVSVEVDFSDDFDSVSFELLDSCLSSSGRPGFGCFA